MKNSFSTTMVVLSLISNSPAAVESPSEAKAYSDVGTTPCIIGGDCSKNRLEESQPVAVWSEQGHARVSHHPHSSPGNDVNYILQIPAQIPAASVCVLFQAPGRSFSALEFRLKLSKQENASPEHISWEIAGVPVRLSREDYGVWRIDYHTIENGWTLLCQTDESVFEDKWHYLRLEYSPDSQRTRLRIDDGDFTAWSAAPSIQEPFLLFAGATAVELSLNDFLVDLSCSASEATSAMNSPSVISNRNTALRREIEDSIREMTARTGRIQHQQLRRPVSVTRVVVPLARGRRQLEVLTPLEEKHSTQETP